MNKFDCHFYEREPLLFAGCPVTEKGSGQLSKHCVYCEYNPQNVGGIEGCCCADCLELTESGEGPDCACDNVPVYIPEQCAACSKKDYCHVPKNPELYPA